MVNPNFEFEDGWHSPNLKFEFVNVASDLIVCSEAYSGQQQRKY